LATVPGIVARRSGAARLSLATHLAPLLASDGASPVARLAQAAGQRLQIVAGQPGDGGVQGQADQLLLRGGQRTGVVGVQIAHERSSLEMVRPAHGGPAVGSVKPQPASDGR